jgi:uncharacterized membrane protein
LATSSKTAIVRVIAAVAMMAIGIDHFVQPAFFVRIVPSVFVGSVVTALLLVRVSGAFEVLGGLGLLVPRTRRAAGIGLVLLYVAVFPANVNMVVHPELGGAIPLWALWARLPFQLVFIALALWVSRR